VIPTMNNDLTTVSHWMTSNYLSLNASQTNYMLLNIGKKCNEVYCHLVLHNFVDGHSCVTSCCFCPSIERVKKAKYLGVIVDENLNL
jgi:hypothetical protein